MAYTFYREELTNWKLCGYYKNVPFQMKSMELGTEQMGVTHWIDATVPGSIYKDLQSAGMIADPYFECNSLACEWVPNRWWVYKTVFTAPQDRGNKLEIVCEGLDFKAHVFLNDVKLASSANMYVPVVVDVTGLVRWGEKNTVLVVLENAPDMDGQIGYTSRTKEQKARFSYKWDWCARLVGMGIHRPVYVREYREKKIEDVYFRSARGGAELTVRMDDTQAECDAVITLTRNGKKAAGCNRKFRGVLQANFAVAEPELWYPNGYGEQPLYDLHIAIYRNKQLCDEKRMQVGFKRFELQENEDAPQGSLHYVFCVNGKKVHVKGVNLTPLDMMHGCVKREKYDALLKKLRDANVNLVRVWGGGLIEYEEFYELCDRYGLMVWQEFIQSSAGIDNVPSTDAGFLAELKRTAVTAAKQKRNHVSLCVWSGGNELTDKNGVPATFKDANIAMLQCVVKEYSPHVPMLPTSASGPNEFADPKNKGGNHDVHGHWKYLGEKGHYEFFNTIDSLFHSEFGVDGMCDRESLKKFLSPANLKVTDVHENLVWRHHGEWWDTRGRDEFIFGPSISLDDMIARSQFVQAEGIRYAIEANRRRAFHNSGSIVWQANDAYPNVFGTSLIDYYMREKPAFGQFAKACAPLNISLKYDAFVWEVGETFNADVFAIYDFDAEDVNIKVKYGYPDEPLQEKTFCVSSGDGYSRKAGSISLEVEQKPYIIVRLFATCADKTFENEIRLCIRQSNGFAHKDVYKSDK